MANVHVAATSRQRGGAHTPSYSRELVTPDKAREWIGLNTHNRTLSKSVVARYARDMANETWAYTGEPIHFNGKGALINGQHRLHACILADKPFEVLVIRDMPLDVQEKLDQGKMRSAADHLRLRGLENGLTLAAAARQLIGIKFGYQPQKAAGNRPTNAEVMAMYEKHPDLAESVGALGKHVLGVHPSLLAAMHYIGAHLLKDRETADSFVSVFASGVPAYRGDPAHLWRERLTNQTTTKSVIRATSKRYAMVYVWNTFRRQEPLQIVRIPDEMPAIEGLNLDLI